MHTRLRTLLGQKGDRENRSISLRMAARETGINPYTINKIANNTLREYPADTIEKLCAYLDCEVGELLILVDPE